jgi:hypothetical protein
MSSDLQFGKVLEKLQTEFLALFRMKLRGERLPALHD